MRTRLCLQSLMVVLAVALAACVADSDVVPRDCEVRASGGSDGLPELPGPNGPGAGDGLSAKWPRRAPLEGGADPCGAPTVAPATTFECYAEGSCRNDLGKIVNHIDGGTFDRQLKSQAIAAMREKWEGTARRQRNCESDFTVKLTTCDAAGYTSAPDRQGACVVEWDPVSDDCILYGTLTADGTCTTHWQGPGTYKTSASLQLACEEVNKVGDTWSGAWACEQCTLSDIAAEWQRFKCSGWCLRPSDGQWAWASYNALNAPNLSVAPKSACEKTLQDSFPNSNQDHRLPMACEFIPPQPK